MTAFSPTCYFEPKPNKGFGALKAFLIDAPKYVAEKSNDLIFDATETWYETPKSSVGTYKHAFIVMPEGIAYSTSRKSMSIEIEETFNALRNKWREETEFLSSPYEMAMNESYQQIIGLGESVVPLILQDLAKYPDHWFWALKSITRHNPVNEQDAGDVAKMAKAWLAWGKAEGFI